MNQIYMKKIINTDKAPQPIGPYNQSVKAGDTLYISGQIAISPITNELVLDTIVLETKQVLDNLKAILKASNLTLEHVVKTSIFISDMSLFNEINTVYSEYFNPETAPARETVAVKELPKSVNVEISAIARG